MKLCGDKTCWRLYKRNFQAGLVARKRPLYWRLLVDQGWDYGSVPSSIQQHALEARVRSVL